MTCQMCAEIQRRGIRPYLDEINYTAEWCQCDTCMEVSYDISLRVTYVGVRGEYHVFVPLKPYRCPYCGHIASEFLYLCGDGAGDLALSLFSRVSPSVEIFEGIE
jgi:hypothetical protein